MLVYYFPAFSRIRTEYGEILRISPYSARMRENTDQKKLRTWTLLTQWKLQQAGNSSSKSKQKLNKNFSLSDENIP